MLQYETPLPFEYWYTDTPLQCPQASIWLIVHKYLLGKMNKQFDLWMAKCNFFFFPVVETRKEVIDQKY